jgi:hypothetical protein
MVAWSVPANAAVDTVSDVPDHTIGFNAAVFAVAYGGNTIYVGGDFTAAIIDGHSTARNRLAAIDANTGALLPWDPNADAQVRAIAVDGPNVYVAGTFNHLGLTARDGLARLDAVTGAVSGGFVHTMTGYPRALAVGNGRLYVGGLFSAIDGVARSNLVAFTTSTGAVDSGWAPRTNDRVNALLATSTRVYVGGVFTLLNGVSGTPRLRAVDPSTGAYLSTWRPPAQYEVFNVAEGPSGVYAAAAGPGGRGYGFNLSTGALMFTRTADGDVQAVNVMGDTVYFGGHFDNVCKSALTGTQGSCVDGNIPRRKAFATEATGALLAWNPDIQGINGVHQFAIDPANHRIAAGGQWCCVHGISQRMFAQFG